MSRCPYLEFIGSSNIFDSTDKDYLCKASGQTMDLYSNKVKCTCDAGYGDEYKKCPVYKNS